MSEIIPVEQYRQMLNGKPKVSTHKYGAKPKEVEGKRFASTKVNVKPMSVNQAWKGRRFKSDEYKAYESHLMSVLPNIELPEPPYTIYLKFGFSSKLSDWDNCVKPTQDILAMRYRFNDREIRKGIVETEMVKKGQEFIEFKIYKYEQ